VIDEYASISCFAGEYLIGNIDTRAILKSRKTAGSSTLTISWGYKFAELYDSSF